MTVKKTLIHYFVQQAKRLHTKTALRYLREGKFVSISWDEWFNQVRTCSLALRKLGVEKGSSVGILSENRYEWTVADLASLGCGAVNVPIYATSSTDEIEYVLKDANVSCLFVSTKEQLDRITPLLKESFQDLKVITFDPVTTSLQNIASYQHLLETGRLQELNNPDLFECSLDEVLPEDVVTYIYTSGTTGQPKGVMLTHENFIENYLGAKEYIQCDESDVALSFLPLSHVFERLAGYYFMIFSGAEIAYAEDMKSVVRDMQTIRPTVAAAVPRFYEKVLEGVENKIREKGGVLEKLYHWACDLGYRCSRKLMNNESLEIKEVLGLKVADVLFFSKIRKALGGRIRFFISGGAPLNTKIAHLFHASGMLVLEGYGLTETSPVIAVNQESAPAFGTVGKPLPNVEVKIAEDGEIMTKSKCVMKGYFNNEEATKEVIKDGWFYTGDIGLLTEEGFLKITDRKKDIIVTSGGKNIAPQKIEKAILSDSSISQFVVLGDKRNYLVGLLVPNKEALMKMSEDIGIGDLPYEEVLRHTGIHSLYKEKVDRLTEEFPSYERVKYFAILGNEFTLSAGELTPTMKIKRRIVQEKYSGVVDSLYDANACAPK